MTETPTDDQQEQTPETSGPTEANCRHCGRSTTVDLAENPDWLCTSCEHYQDSMACPTCGSVVRISLMPDGSAPEPHAPARARKTKGEE